MNKTTWKIGLGALALAAIVIAGTEVDQGKGGRYGPWPVTGVFTFDGGYLEPSPNCCVLDSNGVSVTASGVACTTAGGASCTNIYGGSGGTSYLAYQNLTITIYNQGANTIENVLVEWSADGSAFEVWDSTTFANLTAGSVESMMISGNSRRFLRIEARSSAGSTVNVRVNATNRAF